MRRIVKIYCNTFNRIFRFFWVTLFLLVFHQPCVSIAANIPDPMKPWVDWVLHDKEDQLQCIPQYNNPKELQCNWPTELIVNLNGNGGEFSQSWQIQHESWVTLPGNSKQWPRDVKVDGKPAVVILKQDRPSIQLQPGSYTLTGNFTWSKLPEFLQVPRQTALISLSVNDNTIEFPNIDASGILWLKTDQKEEKIENRLKIESFRRIDDRIPTRIEISVSLDVAGSAREITLGPIYSPDKFIPISLQSSLPARLEQDARIRVQVRPGRHRFVLTIRHIDPIKTLSFEHPRDGFWPEQEIWSFNARSNLRIVEVEGVPSIDPQQTSMPQTWRKHPAYRLLPGDTIRFKEIKRGDPHPAPDQLTLNRSLWLRFDGSGYTIQDNIGGKKNTNWRLEMSPSIELGRIAVDGKEQFITHRQGTDKTGVELRKGILNLTADSSYQGNISTLPATGWDHDFQQVRGRLYLPPGWKLINAGGIDNIPYTWVKRWTLLDFFIVLVFTISLAKLFSKPLAGIAFITLVLTYHEPNAPRYIWLALLIGFALLKHLPESKFKRAVKIYQMAAYLALLIIVIPYSIQALRVGIYPQLARPWTSMTDYSRQRQTASAPTRMKAQEKVLMEQEEVKKAVGMAKDMERSVVADSMGSGRSSYYQSQVMQYDPKALTQTGPGLPEWQPFETINFSWSGPVTRDQKISLTLIGPKTNLVLSFIRVFLIILLAFGMCGIGYRRSEGFYFPNLKSFLVSVFLILSFLNPGVVQAGEIPSQDMLNELQKRLLEKNECFPSCADISDIKITITPEKLSIVASVDAQIDTAVPLPSHVKHWLPQQVIVDDSHAKGLFRLNESLWVLVPSGKHTLKLNGSIRKQNTLQLPFPLKPHHATITANGWSVDGVHPDGTFDTQLQFKRIVEQEDKKTEILETGLLPSFTLVERNILLGLVWKVETRVQRISPRGSAIVMDIPLLPGESVTTEGVQVDNGVAQINLRANQDNMTWESFLEPVDSIILNHSKTDAWTEIWKVDVSPIYHLETDGIPVILHKSGDRWYPTWHPWPGEEVTLKISRPAGIAGQTMTIEKSHLELRPGSRTTHTKLSLTINSSQGGQHIISLPLNAELQEVKIGGKDQPIRQEARKVPLPITPGKQVIELQWRDSEGITPRFRTPEIDLGTQSVNASVDLFLPRSRWPLFVGGEQLAGPAVLFWSVIFIIILVAFGLSRTGLTPLKFYHWVLLGIGMSMSNLSACFLVVGWLIALDIRKKAATIEKRTFNLMQIGIGVITVLAMGSLVFAISHGLLGHPDMNIVGNGSRSDLLRWYQDVSDNTLPRAWVYSVPMFAYRIAMLAWALWISFALVGILKWGWRRFTEPTIWHSSPAKPKKQKEDINLSDDSQSKDGPMEDIEEK
ncbi:hypothetical protein ACFL03_06695 [Thermodesulfobacteriota bacterium]